jgi:hypothetical protein
MTPTDRLTDTATVETLTAEVRALMIGNRQVTLSVYRQLDKADPADCEPFGRVRDNKDSGSAVYVVGRHIGSGALVRSSRWREWRKISFDLAGEFFSVHKYYGRSVDTLISQRDGYSASLAHDPSHLVRRDADASTKFNDPDINTLTWISPQAKWACEAEAEARIASAVAQNALHAEWEALPLIVLAGLR